MFARASSFFVGTRSKASLNERGRAAIVLDTGAVSRGSGSQSSNREKDIRKAFVENDFIEGVVLLPENLFYNTTAPGIVLLLNRNKPASRKGQILLEDAERGTAHEIRIAATLTLLSKVVGDIGVGAHQGYGCLVECGALRFAVLQVRGDFRIAAKVMDMLQFALRRLYRLAKQRQGF